MFPFATPAILSKAQKYTRKELEIFNKSLTSYFFETDGSGNYANASASRFVTLSGTSGTCTITVKGTGYVCTFTTNLKTSADNFVASHASALLAAGVVVLSAGFTTTASLSFVDVGGTAPTVSVTAGTGNLNGAVLTGDVSIAQRPAVSGGLITFTGTEWFLQPLADVKTVIIVCNIPNTASNFMWRGLNQANAQVAASVTATGNLNNISDLRRNGEMALGFLSTQNNALIDIGSWLVAQYTASTDADRGAVSFGATSTGTNILTAGSYACVLTFSFELTEKEKEDIHNYIVKRIEPKGLSLPKIKLPSLIRTVVSPASGYLTIPGPYGVGDEQSQQIHPSWLDAEQEIGTGSTWFGTGYRYIQCNTPFPRIAPGYGNPDIYENPCIFYSNDKTTWVTPGYTNPVFPFPGGSGYNSDVDIFYDAASGRIYLHWREYFVSGGTDELRYMSSYTTNGTTWSAKYQMFFKDIVADPASNILSANRFYDDRVGKYVMYGIKRNTEEIPARMNTIVRAESDTPDGFDGTFVECTMPLYQLSGISGGPWHCEVRKDNRVANGHGHGYVALFSQSNNGAASGVMRLQLFTSIDGFKWFQSQNWLLDASAGVGVTWDGEAAYRASLIKTATGYDMLYGAFGWPTTPTGSRVTHTGLVSFNL